MIGTYEAWADMRRACALPSSSRYANRGARCIRVCAEWEYFKKFLKDMGEEQPYNALFRKEVNANLNPENYYWDLKSRINRVPSSRSRMLTYNGQTQTRSQ
ncbi:MAG TPA: hypothetical protein VIL30_19305 [Ramlibacter sp.]